MHGYPQFSFWISITLVKICFSRVFSKAGKNTFELVGTVLNLWHFILDNVEFSFCCCKHCPGTEKVNLLRIILHVYVLIKSLFWSTALLFDPLQLGS